MDDEEEADDCSCSSEEDEGARLHQRLDDLLYFDDATGYMVRFPCAEAQLVGKGSYGRVYRYPGFDGQVLKHCIFNDAVHARSLLRELVCFRYLRHPCIIQADEVMVPSNYRRKFTSLGVTMCEYPFTLAQARLEDIGSVAIVLKQLLSALAYVHACGIMHRDIKANNVMVDHSGGVALIDFGLATVVCHRGGGRQHEGKRGASQASHTAQVCTPGYRAPEILRAEPYTQAVDIWATGVLAFELFSNIDVPDTHKFQSMLATDAQGPALFDLAREHQQLHDWFGHNGSHSVRCLLQAKLPGAPNVFCDFLSHMLDWDPTTRYSAQRLLQHPFLDRVQLDVLDRFHQPTAAELAAVHAGVRTWLRDDARSLEGMRTRIRSLLNNFG